jgi:outer membrane receptor for ferrienterochelin and colicin
MIKRYVLSLCGVLVSVTTWAQTETSLAGIVQTEAGTPLPGATVFLKGSYLGSSTNQEGRFEVKGVQNRLPAILVVSFVGYENQEFALTQPDLNLEVTLRPSTLLTQVVVAASRVAENIGQVPVTIEKIDLRQLGQLTTPDLVAGLARYKGVDVSSSSMLTTSFSTRGFNSSRSERVIQLADYMDTQLPSLSSNFGNLLGAPILDIASVELVHGPASALYGANAFNGVLLTNSRDPVLDPGLTVRLRGGNRRLLDGQLRYAVKLGDRVAFKISGGATVADDFLAASQDPTAAIIDPTNNPAGSGLGYDAVNRYGDLGNTFTNANGALQSKTVFLPGYSERDLVGSDDKAKSFKVAPSLSVLLSNSVKATLDYRYASATTTYQSASRYRFVNSGAQQARVQVEGSNWFVRAFSTQDFSGKRDPQSDGSYSLGSLGAYLSAQPVLDANGQPQLGANGQPVTYAQRYFGAYSVAYNAAFTANGGNADAAANAAYAAANANAPLLQPGTQAFNDARNRIIHNADPSQGARLLIRSVLSEGSGQYTYKNSFADLTLGGAYRQFLLGSDGSFFADTKDGDRIRNYEYGGYAQASKALLNDHLKLSLAARFDDFKNFGLAFSPRASAVYSVDADKQQNIRASFSRAFRAPTQTDQYVKLDVGRAVVLGNVGNGYQGYTTALGAALVRTPQLLLGGDISAYAYKSDKLKLEEVSTVEAGYRAQLSTGLYVDVDYYLNTYNNFIVTQNFIGNTDGTAITQPQLLAAGLARFQNPALLTRVIQIATNVNKRVQSHGAGLTVNYTFSPALAVAGNYSFNQLLTSFDAGQQAYFNTPRHKFNLGLDGQALDRRLSYNLNYRWAESFLYESTFATGTVPATHTVDAQLGYTLKAAHTTLQAGVTNLFDNQNLQVYGSPGYGRLGYVGLLFDIK